MTDTRQQFWCNMHDSFLGNVAEENPQLLHDHQQHDLSTSSTSTFLRRLTYVEAARKTAQKLATLDTYAKPFRERFTLTSLVGMFLYLLVGLGYYHGHQRLSVLDSVYFSVTTLITVGYGDIRPGSTNERIFTAFYVIFGIFLLSVAISSISTAIYGQYNALVESRLSRMALRMQHEKTRLSTVDANSSLALSAAEAATAVATEGKQEAQNSTPTLHCRPGNKNVLCFLDLSEKPDPLSALGQRLVSGVEGFTSKLGAQPTKEEQTAQQEQQHHQDQLVLDALQALNLDIFDEDLNEMKNNLFHTCILIVFVVVVGWASMVLIEGWNVGDSFYWSVVTITTVGFGDIVPTTKGGKIFTMVYGLVGCAVLAQGLNSLVAYPLTKKSKQSELRVMLQFGEHLSEETLHKILTNDLFEKMPNLRRDDHSISRSEFILLMLSMMNKTHDKDMLIISSIFDVLDKSRVGALSARTLDLHLPGLRGDDSLSPV